MTPSVPVAIVTPRARIECDAADPIAHTTSVRFSTQGPGDETMFRRLQISPEGHLLPGVPVLTR